MTDNATSDVTVIGLGLMGTALAAALVDAGLRVTVWNRSPEKAAALVARGAALANSARDAVQASHVTIICVSTYESVEQALAPAADALTGRTLINVTTGDSAQARRTAQWAEERGTLYLDGAVMAIPPAIGTAEATILLSGPQSGFETQQPTLQALGTTVYLGEDHGLSALYDAAGLTMMWGVLYAWLHGVALLRTAGVNASTYTSFAVQMAQGTAGWLGGYAAQVDAGRYPPNDATLDTHAIGMEHLIGESRRLGVSTELPALFAALVGRAIAAGQGSMSFPVLIEQFSGESQA